MISSLAIATIGLVTLHNPVEANNNHNNYSTTNSAAEHQQFNQSQNKYTSVAISKHRNQDHSNWMTNLTGERLRLSLIEVQVAMRRNMLMHMIKVIMS